MKNDGLGSNSVGEPKWRFSTFFKDVSEELVAKLHVFHTELLKANPSIQLIPTKTITDADYMHFADCYLACKAILTKDQKSTTYDLAGSNGIPGIILAAIDPKRIVIVVDIDGRKIDFVKEMASKLKLPNLQGFVGKVEDIPENTIESAIIRGPQTITNYLLLMRKHTAPTGLVHHLKGNNWAREVGEIPSQICTFWKPELAGEYQLPISGSRQAVVTTIRR